MLSSIMKRSDSRKSVRPSGKSWKKTVAKKQAQKSSNKIFLQRMIERKRKLKK